MKKLALTIYIILMNNSGLFAELQKSPHTFLFCLKSELQPLKISLNRGNLSVGMDEFVDDVNEMEGKEKGFSEWFWSDWESEVDDGFGGEMLERWVEDCE